MLSQVVKAAKGILFTGQSSGQVIATQSTPTTTANTQNSAIATNSEMVSTRRSTYGVEESTDDAGVNGSLEMNGKRKAETTNPANVDTPRNKRQKNSIGEQEVKRDTKEEIAMSANGKHFRFDSEEPELPEITEPEEPAETRQEEQGTEENSSDDEAPEAVDNSVQLSNLKSEAKKRERARQIEEQLKKEKRRQLDEVRKLQAKSSSKRKEAEVKPGAGTPEDLVSESSETLQGSFTQDARRSALPALLPDDILNAVPETRPPTPPPETAGVAQKKPTKIRFLDRKEKAPKDVRMGDVAIRVLDSDSLRKKSNVVSLPPKASKLGRTARDTWLKHARSTGHVNGLRMVKSGSKGFVRK